MNHTNKQVLNGIPCEVRDHAPTTCRTGWAEGSDHVAMVVSFGLHHIKGNPAPYFSVTAAGYTNGREDFGGACHALILQHFPALADIVALHLSDINGAPMHASGNGYYWLAGIVDMGERYHGGSGEFGKSAKECARIAAEHFRTTEQQVIALAGETNKVYKARGSSAARRHVERYTDAQRPRWKAEADAVIRRYKLGVYGHDAKTHAELIGGQA